MLLEDNAHFTHGSLSLLAMLLNREDRIMADAQSRMPRSFDSIDVGLTNLETTSSSKTLISTSRQITKPCRQIDQVPCDAIDLAPAQEATKMKTARPYRSHKYPACSRCHKRRSRCTIETPGSACLLCRSRFFTFNQHH